MKGRWIVKAVEIAILILIVVAGFGQAVLQLWNWLVPSIFGLRPISFWEAVGLLGLSWLLFGGWRGRSYGGHWRRGAGDRWRAMTPEERDQFRKRLRCGSEAPAAET